MKKVGLSLLLTLGIVFAFAIVAHADTDASNRTTATFIQTATSPTGQAITVHSGYTVNTDACALCHAAHQGANDASITDSTKKYQNEFLLYPMADICMSCHDGTVTSTYDVLHGHIGTATDSNGNPALCKGGLFAVEGDSTSASALSASEHDVFSNLKPYSAPGGKKAAGADANGAWSSTDNFTCSSCHSAHGTGGNARLLNPSPNLVQSQGTTGAGIQNATLVDFTSTPCTTGSAYYFNTTTGAGIVKVNTITRNALGTTMSAIPGFRPIITASKGGSVNANASSSATTSNTQIAVKTCSSTYGSITVLKLNTDYSFGYTTTTSALGYKLIRPYIKFLKDPGAKIILVDYTPVLEVNMAIANKLTATEEIKYGAGMTQFCSACHYDYGTSKSADINTLYTKKTHHSGNRSNSSFAQLGNYPVGAGTMLGAIDIGSTAGDSGQSTGSCLTCHFAHGTDATRWGDAGDQIVANPTDPNGQNPIYQDPVLGYGSYKAYCANGNDISKLTSEASGSSQMKRLPNFGVCITCHPQQYVGYSENMN